MSTTQRNRDIKAILTVLNDGAPRSFAQLSLQAGEGLRVALRELIERGRVEERDGLYVLRES